MSAAGKGNVRQESKQELGIKEHNVHSSLKIVPQMKIFTLY